MPKGVRADLSPEQQRKVKQLSFEAARDAFHVGYAKWKAIREADGYLPFRGGASRSAEGEESILDSVRHAPHLCTPRRAETLGISTGTARRRLHHLAKLISLGIAKLDDEWSIRLMGSNPRPGGVDRDDAPEHADSDPKALPFALVMHRKKPRALGLDPDLTEPAPTALGKPPPPDEDSGSLVVLAK